MAGPDNPGEDRAWELLAILSRDDICKAAAVSYYAASRSYVIRFCGMDYLVDVRDRKITGDCRSLFQRLVKFFKAVFVL
jgi:hypothetical protein